MNTEAVDRLSESFRQYDKTELIASALLKELDEPIIQTMVTKYIQDRAAPWTAAEYAQHMLTTTKARTVDYLGEELAQIMRRAANLDDPTQIMKVVREMKELLGQAVPLRSSQSAFPQPADEDER
jgi:hypothetical protein